MTEHFDKLQRLRGHVVDAAIDWRNGAPGHSCKERLRLAIDALLEQQAMSCPQCGSGGLQIALEPGSSLRAVPCGACKGSGVLGERGKEGGDA